MRERDSVDWPEVEVLHPKEKHQIQIKETHSPSNIAGYHKPVTVTWNMVISSHVTSTSFVEHLLLK